jgi:hypothetical protein
MDCVGICPHFGCDGSRLEGWKALARPNGGKDAMMDIFTIVGSTAIAFVIGLMGVYLAKDESTLRHKGMMAEKQ